jgi:transposase
MISRSEFQLLYDQGPDAVYALIVAMQVQIDAMTARVRELEARLNKDSHNSSKPPSSDGLAKKPPKPRSLREQSGKPSGGQPGHAGRTLERVEDPDRMLVTGVGVCTVCNQSLHGAEIVGQQSRQVFDLPPVRLQVTEHQALSCICPHCHSLSQGEFAAGVTQPVQYGPGVLGLCVYLNQYQLVPFARTEQLMTDLFGRSPCEGTLASALTHCHETLAPVDAAIKEAIVAAPVGRFDETGIRVDKRLQWLHVASTPELTWYARHPKRGREAIRDLDILPRFGGVSVHDAFASYQSEEYPSTHALCNAHLLRDLTGLWEATGQTWTKQMVALLCCLKRAKETAQEAGRQSLDAEVRQRFVCVYRHIVERGLRQNPPPERSGRRGRPARGPTRSLLERLQTHESAVLRFAYDFRVPFDNNLAERDLRMTKVRLNISGCFRHDSGADQFCRIRGYISTLRKQGRDVIGALRTLFTGNVLYPSLDSASTRPE